ncbi:UNVERIFIED_CONTAM: hypothetical protein PYX00_002372 [Menopon gallinae]|uniref:G-protein coupled receptors family 1 profile domain-containing protein n=1 Tax=Menopon gallinae TaxID=328185 RepID=A0AAW2IHX0_9NEOP
MVVAIAGNTIVVYVVKSSPRMRSVTNYFIVNLSVGDTLASLICVPFSFVSTLLLRYWPFGGFLCRLVSFWQAVSVIVSAYTMVAISVDRYIAIMSPLRPRMTKKCAKWIIVFLWLTALLTALPIFIVSGVTSPDWWYEKCGRYVCHEQWPKKEYNFIYSVVLMTLQYAIPFFVLVYTYVRIAIVVWGKKPPGEAENTRDQRLAKGKRKVRMRVCACVCEKHCPHR